MTNIEGVCVLFTGHIMRNGYGQRRWRCNATTAHRVAWMIEYGEFSIPVDRYVLHRCHVLYPKGDITYRRCVNVNHLYLGTQQDNIDDMWSSGRYTPHGLPGERHFNSILVNEDVYEIRRLDKEGLTPQQITVALNNKVTIDTIRLILKGKRWTHV